MIEGIVEVGLILFAVISEIGRSEILGVEVLLIIATILMLLAVIFNILARIANLPFKIAALLLLLCFSLLSIHPLIRTWLSLFLDRIALIVKWIERYKKIVTTIFFLGMFSMLAILTYYGDDAIYYFIDNQVTEKQCARNYLAANNLSCDSDDFMTCINNDTLSYVKIIKGDENGQYCDVFVLQRGIINISQ